MDGKGPKKPCNARLRNQKWPLLTSFAENSQVGSAAPFLRVEGGMERGSEAKAVVRALCRALSVVCGVCLPRQIGDSPSLAALPLHIISGTSVSEGTRLQFQRATHILYCVQRGHTVTESELTGFMVLATAQSRHEGEIRLYRIEMGEQIRNASLQWNVARDATTEAAWPMGIASERKAIVPNQSL